MIFTEEDTNKSADVHVDNTTRKVDEEHELFYSDGGTRPSLGFPPRTPMKPPEALASAVSIPATKVDTSLVLRQ